MDEQLFDLGMKLAKLDASVINLISLVTDIRNDVKSVCTQLDEYKSEAEVKFVSKDAFEPVKSFYNKMLLLVSGAIVLALLGLVLKKG